MHMDFLHRDEEKDNSEAHKFLEHQRVLQAQWREELGIDKKEAERIYYLLEWCDAFSLLLCRQQVQPEKRGIEISTGPDGTVYQLFKIEEGVLTVEPWPFDSGTFSVAFESREIQQLKFESSSEFRTAFMQAPVKETIWKLAKKRGPVRKPAKV
jgi:hypothetical protein